jgi:tRNA G10  N-methylase Trm11
MPKLMTRREVIGKPDVSDWTFSGSPTREFTHCYHDYPARMIPQVAGKLLDLYADKAILLFDPYCGTGTSLVEAMMRGIDAVGTDLNPLARFITQVKTTIFKTKAIDGQIEIFKRRITEPLPKSISIPREIDGIKRLDFWFRPEVIEKLAYIKSLLIGLRPDSGRLFFEIAFSETVREVSNTRNEEFKLYRYDAERLKRFKPDVFETMLQKLQRNRVGLQSFIEIMRKSSRIPSAHVYDFNTVDTIPAKKVAPNSVDIVITSPPYGDSHTTVAYGQYSRLSAAWLGFDEPEKVDRQLMGGTRSKAILEFPCKELNEALQQINEIDSKRAFEVSAFYADLYRSILNVAKSIKPSGYACYVVGNRRVKGVSLPTDLAVRDFFEGAGFRHIQTSDRLIPNKRMPLRNSPTNVTGKVNTTMANEYVVIMRR